eukprot:Hpha_TRINITY_DN16307_c2_g9::TRINITY_DN16307_c2_g9_i1::g.59378::m.59378/K10393/KIF2_24, MCAK; kinesin family member 2/24
MSACVYDTSGAHSAGGWSHAPLEAAAHAMVNQDQEERWADARIDGREQLSVREAVLEHRDRFAHAVNDFKVARALAQGARQNRCKLSLFPSCGWEGQPNSFLENLVHTFSGQGAAWDLAQQIATGRPPAVAQAGRVMLCARKRPMLRHETVKGEWDAVECGAARNSILCHEGKMARNGRRLEMNHRLYRFDKVWGESATNSDVYNGCVAPLVKWARKGQGATLLLHGQTGTGKTHTLVGVLERALRELDDKEVGLQLFEVQGKRCLDLLRGRAEVRLMSDSDDGVHVRGGTELRCVLDGGAENLGQALREQQQRQEKEAIDTSAPVSLHQALLVGLAERSSQATERNSASSRSHAVCTITLAGGGSLRLVDLAGSERNYETTMMTAAEHRESAEINSALVALKDCFREWEQLQQGGKGRPPFRASRLTQVLRSCFTDLKHRTALLACVSPCATDMLHTVNTLKHTAMMSTGLATGNQSAKIDLPVRLPPVGKPMELWTSEEVVAWLSSVDGGRFQNVVLPPLTDGRGLCKMSGMAIRLLHARDLRAARVDNEGESWNVAARSGATGAALYAAVERERMLWSGGRERPE